MDVEEEFLFLLYKDLSSRVSILVSGRNTVKIQYKYSKFELRLHDFTVFLMYFPFLPKLWYSKNTEFSIFTVFRHLNAWGQNTDFLDYVPCFFQKTGIKSSNIEQRNMEGGKVNRSR